MKSLLRSFLAWIFTAIFWTLVPILQLLTFKRIPDVIGAKLIRYWAKTTLNILGIRIDLINPSNIEYRASRVNVSNHQSGLDMIVGAALSPEGIVVVAKKEVIYVPFINLGFWAFDFLRIDRKNAKKAIESLSGVAAKIAKDKRTFWILPEGTRSPAGEVRQFKKGAFHIAIEAQAPVHPIVFCGSGELWPKANHLPKSGVISVRFLPPVETKGMTTENVDSLIDTVQRQVEAAYKEMYRAQFGKDSKVH